VFALTLSSTSWRRRRPASWALMGVAVVTAALLAFGIDRAFEATRGDLIHEAVSQGRVVPAPGFDLEVLNAGDLGAAPRRWWRAAHDGRVSLAELRGTPTVINFWTGRCTPCREEGHRLQQAARAAGHGLLVLGVSSEPSSRRAYASLDRLGLSFPQLLDGSGETARRWGVDGVPETFFLSPDGAIVAHVVGAATARQLRRGVAAAIAGRPAGLHRGGGRQALE
jgi:cytochrome c biogenesis protein CcmG/thiol:disulfide interchange protein DsbE